MALCWPRVSDVVASKERDILAYQVLPELDEDAAILLQDPKCPLRASLMAFPQ